MDDSNEARAKARELLKMVIKEQLPDEVWEEIFEHFCPSFEQRIREHYEKHGEWPHFYKNPDGGVTSNLAMGLIPPTHAAIGGFPGRKSEMAFESGKIPLQLRENDLRDCLDEMAKHWAEAFQRKGVRLEVQLDPSIPRFRFDYQKVQQATVNLLDSALTHTPSGGSVTLNSTLRPDGAEVSVIGALEHDQQILDGYSTVPLFHAQTIEESRALGLAIAKRLVLAHHGRIWVEASSTGSRYAFLIPTDQG